MLDQKRNPHTENIIELLFYLGLALLIGHELDAVAQSEWRLLPGLSSLPERTARAIFIAAHVPLTVALLYLLNSQTPKTRINARIGADLFLILHVALHLLFSEQEHYAFHSPLSQVLIYGGGIIGALHFKMLMPLIKNKKRQGR